MDNDPKQTSKGREMEWASFDEARKPEDQKQKGTDDSCSKGLAEGCHKGENSVGGCLRVLNLGSH